MKGKLIIIESGTDGSGKATQTQKLFERLSDEKYKVKKITFPDYNSDSSALVKMYLNGDFGQNPGDVSPYVASTFYAVDRFASYKTNWGKYFEGGGIILSDRYVTSNMVHQGAKIKDMAQKDAFLDWLWTFEFNIYGLPVPDCVLFLDMPPNHSKVLMDHRMNKFTGEDQKDIHERNYQYLLESYNNSLYIAKKYNWLRINCVKDKELLSIESIHEIIFNKTKEVLNAM